MTYSEAGLIEPNSLRDATSTPAFNVIAPISIRHTIRPAELNYNPSGGAAFETPRPPSVGGSIFAGDKPRFLNGDVFREKPIGLDYRRWPPVNRPIMSPPKSLVSVVTGPRPKVSSAPQAFSNPAPIYDTEEIYGLTEHAIEQEIWAEEWVEEQRLENKVVEHSHDLNPSPVPLNNGDFIGSLGLASSTGGGGSATAALRSPSSYRSAWPPLPTNRGANGGVIGSRGSIRSTPNPTTRTAPSAPRTYPWSGRPAVQRPFSPPTDTLQPRFTPRNAAPLRPSSNPFARPYQPWSAVQDAAARRTAELTRGLSAPKFIPTSPIVVPGAASILSKGAGVASKLLNPLSKVPFLSDLLFPEGTGDLTPEAVRRAKKLDPPISRSPGGTPPSPKPTPPPKPERRYPVGSSAKPYRILSNYAQGSNSRMVLVSSNPTTYKAQFLNWLVTGSSDITLTGPLTIEYIPADPARVANYLNPPSPWKHILVRHAGGSWYLAQGGEFATASWAIYSTDGLPEPFIPGGAPYIFDPPPDTPPVPQPPQRVGSNSRTGRGTGTEFFPGLTDKDFTITPPGLIPSSMPHPPLIPSRTPSLPDRENPLDPNNPVRRRTRLLERRRIRFPTNPPPTPINPPSTPLPPNLPPARSPCTPKGSLENVTCRYSANNDFNTAEILRRLGNPGTGPNGLSGILSTDEDSLKNTIGKPIRGKTGKIVGITDWLKNMRATQLLMQALGMLNIVLLLHNAAMLSRNVVESVGDMLSMGMQAIKTIATGGTSTDDPIDINELVGQGFQGLMTDIFGKAQWTEIQAKWINFNRIITSAANVAYSIQGVFDGARNILEITSTNVARIGNALKNSRVVNQGAFPFMNPNINSATGRFAKLQQTLDNSSELADIGTSIAGETINISEEAKELADNKTRFESAVTEGTTLVNDAGELVDKDGKIIRDSNKQQGSLAESARRVSQGSEFSTLDMLRGDEAKGG